MGVGVGGGFRQRGWGWDGMWNLECEMYFGADVRGSVVGRGRMRWGFGGVTGEFLKNSNGTG